MKWICVVCGYKIECEEKDLPNFCPQCGVPKDKFEKLDEEEKS